MSSNEYIKIQIISINHFSIDYQVLKVGTQEIYALKEININNNFKSFRIEEAINILKDINHPNISRLIDFKINLNYFYIITEYYNGGNLDQHLKANQIDLLNEEEVQYIMKQVINIVKYLHDKKIVHRNLIIDNLLLNYESEKDLIEKNLLKAKIKLGDFGMSSHLSKGNFLYERVGHVKYVAPEVFRSQKYDEKIDIWSLGVICSKLLIGDFPYNSEILNNQGSGDSVFYYLPETLSKEAISFINCMLQYNPNLRKSVDNLAKHEFLTKNVKDFNKVKICDIKEHIEDTKIKINIIDNQWVSEYFGNGIDE